MSFDLRKEENRKDRKKSFIENYSGVCIELIYQNRINN